MDQLADGWTLAMGWFFTLGLSVSACAGCMTDRSFDGSPPPLSANERAVQNRLRTHVYELAAGIGERNRQNYERLERARHYIEEQLRQAGYNAESRPFVFRGETFFNIEAILPGNELPNDNVVIGAHYDSVEGSPGANDNASGVAALVELARVLRGQELAATVRFVAFANEESPYFNTGEGMGSIQYVRSLEDTANSVRCMLSLETVGLYSNEPGSQKYPPLIGFLYPKRGNFIAFVGNVRSRSLVRRVVRSFRRTATLPSQWAALPASIPGVAWSDHRSFWEVGIPALMVTDTALFRDASYHLPSDTPERLDYESMTRLVMGLSRVVMELAGSEC